MNPNKENDRKLHQFRDISDTACQITEAQDNVLIIPNLYHFTCMPRLYTVVKTYLENHIKVQVRSSHY